MKHTAQKLLQYKGNTQIASKDNILKFYEQCYASRKIDMLSFYNSELDMIIEDPSLMNIPIDERLINRAHGVFESLAIKNYTFLSQDLHLQRLQLSAQKAGIKMPLPMEKIKNIMNDMAQFSYTKLAKQPNLTQEQIESTNINMRLWVSSGRGDFGIYSVEKQPIFYCSTFVNYSLNKNLSNLEEGIKEYTLKSQVFDELETAKTVSYIKNCVQANYSKEKGGYQGIRLNEKGQVLELAMANVGYINKNTLELIVTPNEHIVAGTTLKKVIENYVKPILIQEKQVLKGVKEQYFTPEQILTEGSEFISFGGDKVIPILEIDDQKVGEGKKGSICQNIQDWYKTLKDVVNETHINFNE